MKIEERVAQAILAYNRIINVMSPDTVYMGREEYHQAWLEHKGAFPMETFMGLSVVPVTLPEYLQVARGVK